MTVGLALLLWSVGLPTLFRTINAEAISLQDASDVLSNSAPGLLSDHTFTFTTVNGLLVGQTIDITFPTTGGGFILDTDFGAEDMEMTVNGDATTTQNGANGAGIWGLATTTNSVTLTSPSDFDVASSSVIVIYLGRSGPNAAGTEDQITNPTATSSYEITIDGTMSDSGAVRVAIIDEITVSASVNTSLTFTVSGLNASSTVNGSATSTAATTTSVTLPFGALAIGQSKTLGQRLNVSTNASAGYTVTVQQATELQSGTGDVIDGFVDGSWTQTPTDWQGPSADVTDVNTYGHWGLTSTDGTTTRSSQFSADKWVSGSTSPIIIMGHEGPADGLTEGVGSTTVGYQIEISALQEAGDDYTTTLRYIATPKF
jgi:hypothetical protein